MLLGISGLIHAQAKKRTPADYKALFSKFTREQLSDSLYKHCKNCYVYEIENNETDTTPAYHNELWDQSRKDILGPYEMNPLEDLYILHRDTLPSWKVRVSEIYIGHVTAEIAGMVMMEVNQRMANGETFAACASELSNDDLRMNGGDMGWVGPGQTVPQFEKAIQSYAQGTVYLVQTIEFGWILVYQATTPQPAKKIKITGVMVRKG